MTLEPTIGDVSLGSWLWLKRICEEEYEDAIWFESQSGPVSDEEYAWLTARLLDEAEQDELDREEQPEVDADVADQHAGFWRLVG